MVLNLIKYKYFGGSYKNHHFKCICCIEYVNGENRNIVVHEIKKKQKCDEFSVAKKYNSTIDVSILQAILLVFIMIKT